MYTQVYFHDVRRAYDIHLGDFLRKFLNRGKFTTDWKTILSLTDDEILVEIRKAAEDSNHELHDLAGRLFSRKHFRTVYQLVSVHRDANPNIFEDIFQAVTEEIGPENVRKVVYGPKPEIIDFPVVIEEGAIERSVEVSGVIKNVPLLEIGLILVKQDKQKKARSIVKKKISELPLKKGTRKNEFQST